MTDQVAILTGKKPVELCSSALLMESSSFGSNLSQWEFLNLFLVRPILAVVFTFFFIFLGWFLAWKLVLVHVPLVQEVFGLRKKPVRPKPPTGRLSKFYSSLNSQNSPSGSEETTKIGQK